MSLRHSSQSSISTCAECIHRSTTIQCLKAAKEGVPVCGLLEEAREPEENPRRHRENVQTPHRPGMEPTTLMPWGGSANCATVSP